jgi:hypothetical protein
VRYERLVSDTEAVLREVCEFLELDFDEAMLDPSSRSAIEEELGPVGCWRDRLTAEDADAFGDVAGDLLRQLGYE